MKTWSVRIRIGSYKSLMKNLTEVQEMYFIIKNVVVKIA